MKVKLTTSITQKAYTRLRMLVASQGTNISKWIEERIWEGYIPNRTIIVDLKGLKNLVKKYDEVKARNLYPLEIESSEDCIEVHYSDHRTFYLENGKVCHNRFEDDPKSAKASISWESYKEDFEVDLSQFD